MAPWALGIMLFTKAGAGALVITMEVEDISYLWGAETAFFAYNTLAGNGELGAAPLPAFEANLADFNTITLRFVAPSGFFFSWNPVFEDAFANAAPVAFIWYNDDPDIDFLEADSTNFQFLGYEGDPINVPELTAGILVDGSGFFIESCVCLDVPSNPATFTAIEIFIDYSGITDRDGWQQTDFEPFEESFLSFVTAPSPLEDPGQFLTIVPEPRTGLLLPLAGLFYLLLRSRQNRPLHEPRRA